MIFGQNYSYTYSINASIENQDTEINKSERYFPVTIKAENGNLIDGDIEIGQFDFFLNINQYSDNSSLEKYKFRLKSSQNFPVSYIAQFFQDVESIGDKKETIFFKSVNNFFQSHFSFKLCGDIKSLSV